MKEMKMLHQKIFNAKKKKCKRETEEQKDVRHREQKVKWKM